MDKWAWAGWRGNPLIALLDFGDNGSRRIVEIHNKADGNCLLHALAFYLCVARADWNQTVVELRKSILLDVATRLRDPNAFESFQVQSELSEAEEPGLSPEPDDLAARYVSSREKGGVYLGDLEIAAFTRLYKTGVCVWQVDEHRQVLHRISRTPANGSDNIELTSTDMVPDFGTDVHLRFYPDPGHYTLLALLDSEASGFGRPRRRYV
jgi:hypothetical protein